jgi:hypothetical protein
MFALFACDALNARIRERGSPAARANFCVHWAPEGFAAPLKKWAPPALQKGSREIYSDLCG